MRWESMIDRSVVGDYIAVYKPEQIWTDAPPQPEFTGRPVVRFIDGTRRALNTIYSEQFRTEKTELMAVTQRPEHNGAASSRGLPKTQRVMGAASRRRTATSGKNSMSKKIVVYSQPV